MTSPTPQEQLDGFLDRFAPDVAAKARIAIGWMRARLPGAVELVYDNYNALAVGYGPTEKRDDAIFSIAVFPRRPSLVFTWGVRLDDPGGLLRGEGNQVRSIPLDDLAALDDLRVHALIDQAMAKADVPLDPAQPFRTVIKSISAKQRPRRPS